MNFIAAWSFAEDLYFENPMLSGDHLSEGNIFAQTNCSIDNGVNVFFEANLSVYLKPGFHGKTGCVFTAMPGDGDGIPNTWELAYFSHYDWGADDDPDGDGLTNMQEYILGTDPTDGATETDTDDDGLPDWWELTYFTDLNDVEYFGDNDNDGFKNFIEFKFGSQPNNTESKPKPGCIYEYDALGRIKKVYRVQ